MPLNYSVAIKCIDETGNNIGDAKIHAYFNKVNPSSSSSKWNDVIRRTSGNGLTSFNLGDGSFLTSEGKIDTGDTILITAWLTDNNDILIDDKTSKSTGTITRCVNFVHTVNVDSSSYSEVVTVMLVKSPICDFTIPTVTLTGHPFTITNASTIDVGPYTINGRNDLYQELTHYNQDIFLGRAIKETVYDLGEDLSTLPFTDDKNYSYIDAGDWLQNLKVYDFLGFYCETNDAQHILYNQPTIAFDYSFSKLYNTNKHIGVGNDDIMTTIQQSAVNFGDTWAQILATFDWVVTDTDQSLADNSTSYLAQNENFNFSKTFLSEGQKDLTLTIRWNDGFTDQIEVLTRNPFLDIYSIGLGFDWITQKLFKPDALYIPLGDDDLVTLTTANFDNASQDYYSNTEWIDLEYQITKKKNDGSDDSQTFFYENGVNPYDTDSEFFVKFHHITGDEVVILETLNYWDGFKAVNKTLSKTLTTQDYSINNAFHWETANGLNAVVTRDDDEVTLVNDTLVLPQNNQGTITAFTYTVAKDQWTSYTDATILDDTEIFTTALKADNFNFFIRKDGDWDVTLVVDYYDGYQMLSSQTQKTIISRPLTPTADFHWQSRLGLSTFIEGRDDEVTFFDDSSSVDYYGNAYTRFLGVDWRLTNKITAGNFSNIAIIGGSTFALTDATATDEFLFKTSAYTPKINYWTATPGQNAVLKFYYNDGFFNRDTEVSKMVVTNPYADLIPNASYTQAVEHRDDDITFLDASTSNETRIIDTDWSLTDRYEANSMNTQNRGDNAFKTWKNVQRLDSRTTRVNSNENHTLSQDIVRWDDGFKLKKFNNQYTITTSNHDIVPSFGYSQKYVTGPEINFVNTTTVNGRATQIKYNLTVTDKDNSNVDASVVFSGILPTTGVYYVYKSVSNSPFDPDIANKPVTIDVIYDDGWNEVNDGYSEIILVKPNRIDQSFVTNPIRHPNDNGTQNDEIIGNNPIEFHDTSTTLRIDDNGDADYGFIQSVEYVIIDTCNL